MAVEIIMKLSNHYPLWVRTLSLLFLFLSLHIFCLFLFLTLSIHFSLSLSFFLWFSHRYLFFVLFLFLSLSLSLSLFLSRYLSNWSTHHRCEHTRPQGQFLSTQLKQELTFAKSLQIITSPFHFCPPGKKSEAIKNFCLREKKIGKEFDPTFGSKGSTATHLLYWLWFK